jgi:hypothetical protein
MFHSNMMVKAAGLLVTIASFCALLGLHAFAGHFRDATAAVGETHALVVALETLKATPWRLADINSYYLFGLGALFTISAFFKGFTFDDPHPRYGAMDRREKEARESYSDEHANLFDELAEIKDDTIKALDVGINRLPNFPQHAANIRAERSALIETFRAYETGAQRAANQLLERYRDKNRRNRNTSPPSHFDQAWSLPHSFLSSVEARSLINPLDDTRVDITATLAELRQLSRTLLDEYEKLMRSYPHPTAMH